MTRGALISCVVVALLSGGCTSRGPAASPPTGTSSEASPSQSVPSTTSYEDSLASVLTEIGVRSPGSVEHEFKGARVGGPWHGRYAVVFASENTDAIPPSDDGTERTINGVRVGTFTDASAGTAARFVCHGLTYSAASMRAEDARGTSTGPAALMLARQLLRVLQCP